MISISSDEENEGDTPALWQRPAPPARATIGADAASRARMAEEDAQQPQQPQQPVPLQVREKTLPAPPAGWSYAKQELILMADGATTADKGLFEVIHSEIVTSATASETDLATTTDLGALGTGVPL